MSRAYERSKGVGEARFVRAVVGSYKPSLLSIGDSDNRNGCANLPKALKLYSEGKVRLEPVSLVQPRRRNKERTVKSGLITC